MHTHLCTCVYTVHTCSDSLYIDACMHVYAGIPMGTKASLNYPSGGVSSPKLETQLDWKPNLPHGWREVPPIPPAAKGAAGAEAEPRSSPGPVSCRRRRERDPKWSPAPPETIPAGCSHRHRWVRDTPTHSRHTARVPPRREGRGGERKQAFSPFSFVCNWDRLQAQSLKSLLKCFRAKVNSPQH